MIKKTYIINLLRRQDKHAHMVQELQKFKENNPTYDLSPSFFPAIDGEKLDNESYSFSTASWSDPNSGKSITKGEIGCALSHYNIWLDIVNNYSDNSLFLILEDDVIFLDNFVQNFTSAINSIKIPFDLIYLHRKPLNLSAEKSISDSVNICAKSYWTCAYAITLSCAKKLVNSSFLSNIIPVDEFLPIMYNCKVNQFEKLFESNEKITALAIKSPLLKLTSNAFSDSETFHSNSHFNPFEAPQTNLYIVYSGEKSPRFESNCKIYGLTIIYTESSYSKIKECIEQLNQINPNCLVLLIITNNPIQSILPIAPPSEIIEKYNSMKFPIVTIGYNHSSSNPLILLSTIDPLLMILSQALTLSSNLPLQTILMINHSTQPESISIDEQKIFLPIINSSKIAFNHKASRVISSLSTPCIIISSDPHSNIITNRIENYTGSGWNEHYGSTQTKNPLPNPLPLIYLSIYHKGNPAVLRAKDISYPKELLLINIHKNELSQSDITNFIQSNAEYYFFISDSSVLTNPNVLYELLEKDKDVISPLIRKPNEAWSNFWGDLDQKGYYKRSEDYFNLLNRERLGCWNVPYVTGVYLIKRHVLINNDLLEKNNSIDLDMRICHNLREKNILMYMINNNEYGYIEEIETPINNFVSDPQELTLYDVLTKKSDWERKYLHRDFYSNLNTLSNISYKEICPDIYSFPIFSLEFCSEMIKRMEALGKWSAGKDSHIDERLGKNHYEPVPTKDIQFFQIQWDKQWEYIVMTYIAKVISLKYSFYKTKGVNLGFVVRYKPDEQAELSLHHDASTVTINVALNKGGGVDYDGGGCYFQRQNVQVVNQDIGMGLLHPGRLTAYHKGLKTTSGIRYILVSFIN